MTKSANSTSVRYNEGCLAAHSLNLIGDRWALLVVRELMFSPKRFQLIRAGVPGISATVLTARLTQLREAVIINHDERLGIYSLTEAGRGLLPVLHSLCRWAVTVPGHDPTRFISPSALIISMSVTLNRELAGNRTVSGGFDFGREVFDVRLDKGTLTSTAIDRPETPFVIRANGNYSAKAVYGKVPLPDLCAAKVIEVDGDLAAAQNFVGLFDLENARSVPA